MGNKNEVSQVRLEFNADEPLADVLDAARANLSMFNACIVVRRDDKVNVRITYCEGYNLLPPDIVLQHIITAMSAVSDVTVHSQIPLDKFILQYEQMINTVASDICKYLHVPFDDYYQEVCLTLVRLRNEGRYIHKALLRKAAFNDCLKVFKKEIKHQQYIDEDGEPHARQVSMYNRPDSDDDATYADILEDEKAIAEFDDFDKDDETSKFIEEIKKCCSPREFSELLRAYRTNTTSNHTNVIIRKIKKELGL